MCVCVSACVHVLCVCMCMYVCMSECVIVWGCDAISGGVFTFYG